MNIGLEKERLEEVIDNENLKGVRYSIFEDFPDEARVAYSTRVAYSIRLDLDKTHSGFVVRNLDERGWTDEKDPMGNIQFYKNILEAEKDFLNRLKGMKKLNVDKVTRYGEQPLYPSKIWDDLEPNKEAISEYKKYMDSL